MVAEVARVGTARGVYIVKTRFGAPATEKFTIEIRSVSCLQIEVRTIAEA
jgi:hypothetical protein